MWNRECPGLGVKSSENSLPGPLFANEFVGVAKTRWALQKLIDIVHNCSKHWHSEANVKESAVVIFQNEAMFREGGFVVVKALPSWILIVI